MKQVSHPVQVWRIALDDFTRPRLATLRGTLDDDEIARMEKLAFPLLRDRFVVAHAALRSILGQALDTAPKDVGFSFGPYGKPAFAAPESTIAFNLSHSAALAVVALTDGRAVGVDVEKVRPDVAHEDIARRFLSPAEADTLLALPPEQRTLAFFRAWTRREALVKMLGLGLSDQLDAIDAGRFTTADLDVGAGYVGALAVDSLSPLEIVHRDWVP
jgi:4'-phosphopantetheinyl transferase